MSCFQGDVDGAAGKEKEEDIGDLDDLLRREREMEKKRKESAPVDAEVWYKLWYIIVKKLDVKCSFDD